MTEAETITTRAARRRDASIENISWDLLRLIFLREGKIAGRAWSAWAEDAPAAVREHLVNVLSILSSSLSGLDEELRDSLMSVYFASAKKIRFTAGLRLRHRGVGDLPRPRPQHRRVREQSAQGIGRRGHRDRWPPPSSRHHGRADPRHDPDRQSQPSQDRRVPERPGDRTSAHDPTRAHYPPPRPCLGEPVHEDHG